MPELVQPMDTLHLMLMDMGQLGSTYESGTTVLTAETGRFWGKIYCVTATVFTTLTDAGRDGDTFTGVSHAAGVVIYGRFTAITLTSGSILAYKA